MDLEAEIPTLPGEEIEPDAHRRCLEDHVRLHRTRAPGFLRIQQDLRVALEVLARARAGRFVERRFVQVVRVIDA